MSKLDKRLNNAPDAFLLVPTIGVADAVANLTYDQILDVIEYVDRVQADSYFTKKLKERVKKL